MNATKSGSGYWSSRLTQSMCPNTFCWSLIYKLSPSFRSPACKGMTKWQRPSLVMKAGWDIQGQNLSLLLTQSTCWCIWDLFTFFSCLHILQHFTAWETLHGTDFLPDAEHPQLQLLQECPTPQLRALQHPAGISPSKQLTITGTWALEQGRRFINNWSKGFVCSTASCPLHFRASL